MVKEALRVFGGYAPAQSDQSITDPNHLGVPVPVDPEAVYTNRHPDHDRKEPAESAYLGSIAEGLIVPCQNCGVKNRIPKPPRLDGMYTCGRCKKIILSLPVFSSSKKGSNFVEQRQLKLPLMDDALVAKQSAVSVACSECSEDLFGRPKIGIEGNVFCYRCAKRKELVLKAAKEKEADSKYQLELASFVERRIDFEGKYAIWERRRCEYVGSFFRIRLIWALGGYLVWLPYLLGFTFFFLVMTSEANGWDAFAAWIIGFAGGIYLVGKVPLLESKLTEEFCKKNPQPLFSESYPRRHPVVVEKSLLPPDGSTLENEDYRPYILRRDDFRCQACGVKPPLPADDLEVHHVLPVSKGGLDDPTNMITLCKYHHDREEWFGHVRAFPTTLIKFAISPER
jgi:hypothetical protein